DGSGPFGTAPFLGAFLKALGRPKVEPPGSLPERRRPLTLPSPPSDGGEGRVRGTDATARLKRQFAEILHYSERLIDESAYAREAFLSKLDTRQGVRDYIASAKPYRAYFGEKILGRIPDELSAPTPRTRLTYDTPEFRGYEVVLDVLPDVILYGILLLPKDLKPGDKRPVIVCQHGLEGRPRTPSKGTERPTATSRPGWPGAASSPSHRNTSTGAGTAS